MSKKDFSASLVVFLIALPLSLGIALASGAGAQAGLIAAVIGGVVVGLISGAPLQVSGPAAGLSVMVYGLIQNYGFGKTCLIASIAGGLQIILGLLKVSRVALMIAPAVIHGMLAGIGVLIALGQSHVVLGHKPYSSGPLNILHLWDSVHSTNGSALVLGVFTILIVVFWKKLLPRVNRIVPGSLVAVIVLTALASIFSLEVARVALDSEGFGFKLGWEFPQEVSEWSKIGLSALALLVVASAESLLCAIATDRLHSGKRADLDRELLAQGVGNTLSGALGGLPITGVIVRSAANISSGAETRWSAILHGIWILIFVLLAKPLIAAIPLSVLAGLLIHVGVNLVKFEQIHHLSRYREHWIYFATLGGVVLFGLLNGIALGLFLSLAAFLHRTAKIEAKVEQATADDVEVFLKGSLTFLSAPKVSQLLSEIPLGKSVRFHLDLSQIDLTGLEIVRGWKEQYLHSGGRVEKPNLDQWMFR